jgi:archaellum biogenesis ATPase FlaH
MKRLPGSELIFNESQLLDYGLFLLVGPKLSGKTCYCNNFLINALRNNSFCVYVSSSYSEKQFANLFRSVDKNIITKSALINPYVVSISKFDSHSPSSSNFPPPSSTEDKLRLTDLRIKKAIQSHSNESICFIMDSLTNLLAYFEMQPLLKFLVDLIYCLKEKDIVSVFTLDPSDVESAAFYNKISHLFDGIMETKIISANKDSPLRQIRLASLIGTNTEFPWIRFDIDEDCGIRFSNNRVTLICNICKEPIRETPVFYSDLAFHKDHLNIYMKLISFYGNNQISEIGSSGIMHANFFFIDIVGLSDPLLSVKKQIEKIHILNNLISTCSSYKKDRNKKVLPTGDGMAIGFTSDPKLPLDLSMELQQKLKSHNKNMDEESKVKVRIGIGSGHVFLVNDLNDNQNVWGPGIILARRVMDLGDDGHILLEGELAKTILTIDDEYDKVIHYIGDYKIKHNQIIKVYSVYGDKIGNAQIPSKFSQFS